MTAKLPQVASSSSCPDDGVADDQGWPPPGLAELQTTSPLPRGLPRGRLGRPWWRRRRGLPRTTHRHCPLRRPPRASSSLRGTEQRWLKLGLFPQPLRLAYTRRSKPHPFTQGAALASARRVASLGLRRLMRGRGGPADRYTRRSGAVGGRLAQGGVRLRDQAHSSHRLTFDVWRLADTTCCPHAREGRGRYCT